MHRIGSFSLSLPGRWLVSVQLKCQIAQPARGRRTVNMHLGAVDCHFEPKTGRGMQFAPSERARRSRRTLTCQGSIMIVVAREAQQPLVLTRYDRQIYHAAVAAL